MFNIFKRSRQFLRLGNLTKDRSSHVAFLCTQSENAVDLAALAKGDKELEHKIKILTLEIDVLRQEGKLVPDDEYIKEAHWKELISLQSLSQRRKFLEFLFKIQKKQENRKVKKELKREQHIPRASVKNENETFEEWVSQYDLNHNNIFLRIYETTMNQMYNNRLIQAMKFGQKLVVDCGYHEDMTKMENRNCGKQLTLLFAENRAHDDPFDLHYCNADRSSLLIHTLNKYITTLYEPWFPLNLHECSYTEQFPKDKLVYLTPHCREEMVEYDHDAIYIIGAIVDKVNSLPLSMAKAKREGLKMAKLPLDRYLQWGSGAGKSLTLNQVVSILLDVKRTGDWKYAMRHVPRRKVVDVNQEVAEREAQREAQRILKKQTRKWSPSKKIDFDNLSYKDKGRRVEVKSLMND